MAYTSARRQVHADPAAAPTRLRFSIAGAAVLTTALLFVCVPWLFDIRNDSLAFLALVTVLTGVLGLCVAASNGVRPVAIVFFAFVTSWLTLPAIYQSSVGRGAWQDSAGFTDPARLTQAFVLILVSLLCFLLGYLSGAKKRRTAVDRHVPVEKQSDRVRPPLWACFALFAASSTLVPQLVRAAGGVSGLFSSRLEISEAIGDAGLTGDGGSGASTALVRLIPGALALAGTILVLVRMWGTKRFGETRRNGPLDYVALIWGLSLIAVFMNPFTSARFLAFGAIASLFFIRWRPIGRRAAWVVAGGVLFALLLLYPLANVLRYGLDSGEGLRLGTSAFLSADFDGFQQLMNAMDYVDNHGVAGGLQTLSALLIFVPRSLWPGKATPTNVLVAEDRGYVFTNLSIPAPAEFFVDFAWPGLIILMIIWGVLARRLDDSWLLSSPSYPVIAFFAISQIILIRGPLSGSTGFIGLVVLVLIVFTRRRRVATQRARVHHSLGQSAPLLLATGTHHRTAIGSDRTSGERFGL